jgi:hypothetical protein
MSRFGCACVSLSLRGLPVRMRRAMCVELGLSVVGHLSLSGCRGLAEEQRVVKPLTTQFIKRQPRLTKPLELKKLPKPGHRQIRRKMVAAADFLTITMTRILDSVRVGGFLSWEDVTHEAAAPISPEQARCHMLPRHKKVVELLVNRDVPPVGLDRDEHIDSLMPVWLDADTNVLFPFEVQADVDVVRVSKKYGRNLRIWVGVDKRALAQAPTAIHAELFRLKPSIDEGGYIPDTGYLIPPDVSYQSCCYHTKRLPEICSRESEQSISDG